jgi:hypothetical protein
MSENKPSDQPPQPAQAAASSISRMFGPTRLLPGESAEVYRAGLIATIKDLGATTHLQTYLAEKIFQCLWWLRRYEVQKQASIVNAMVSLLTDYGTPKDQRLAITYNLQAHLWSEPQMIKIIEVHGHTPESLASKAMTNAGDEMQKLDALIALRVKALAQLQQSYEALVNRSVMQERLKLQNELLRRDLRSIDVVSVEQVEPLSDVKTKNRGNPKTKSG